MIRETKILLAIFALWFVAAGLFYLVGRVG
jgi:hypothetical protein